MFAADQLLGSLEKIPDRAYIVNTNEIDKPGTHRLAIFTKNYKCEVFDSYGLPLNWYKASDIVEWVFKNFETINSNAVTLQDMESQSCGQYALMYLIMKARGKSMHDFISLFKKGNYVFNDHLVGEMVKPLLDGELGILNVVNMTIWDVVVWIYKQKTLFFIYIKIIMKPCRSFKFHSLCSIMVVGPSSCGKTVFVEKLLKERSRLFTPPYNPVVYCYSANQPTMFERMKKEQGIHFYEGILDTQLLDKWYKKTKGGILVLDDLMREGSDDHRVLDLLTRDSHHRGINVIFMTQDMFLKGKHAKTISRNAHYIIAFKNPRDQLGVRILTQQAFPQEFKDVLNIYRDATERPYR